MQELEVALTRLLAGELSWVAVSDGALRMGERWEGLAILSGSFNPLHDGHKGLAAAASAFLGQEVVFELPLQNADKAPIDAGEAARRAAQFAGVGTLLLSCAPLFSHKARVFPGSVFVVGADTAARLLAPRFYGHDEAKRHAALRALQRAACRLLVAGRRVGDGFVTLGQLAVPEVYRALFIALPESCFRLDISSTALRGARQDAR